MGAQTFPKCLCPYQNSAANPQGGGSSFVQYSTVPARGRGKLGQEPEVRQTLCVQKDEEEYHEWRWPIPTAMRGSWFFKAPDRHLTPLTRSYRPGLYDLYAQDV
jgi:hypothetical protein